MSDQVGNSEDRFSRDAAHFMSHGCVEQGRAGCLTLLLVDIASRDNTLHQTLSVRVGVPLLTRPTSGNTDPDQTPLLAYKCQMQLFSCRDSFDTSK